MFCVKKKSEHRWVCSFVGAIIWVWGPLHEELRSLALVPSWGQDHLLASHLLSARSESARQHLNSPALCLISFLTHDSEDSFLLSLSSEMSTRERGQAWGHTPRGWRQARQIRSTGSCSGYIVISKPSLGYKETPWLCLKSKHTQLTVGKIKN